MVPAYLKKNRKTQKNTPKKRGGKRKRKRKQRKEGGEEAKRGKKEVKKRLKEVKRPLFNDLFGTDSKQIPWILCKIKELTVLKRDWFR